MGNIFRGSGNTISSLGCYSMWTHNTTLPASLEEVLTKPRLGLGPLFVGRLNTSNSETYICPRSLCQTSRFLMFFALGKGETIYVLVISYEEYAIHRLVLKQRESANEEYTRLGSFKTYRYEPFQEVPDYEVQVKRFIRTIRIE
jgi:hypothetical protein